MKLTGLSVFLILVLTISCTNVRKRTVTIDPDNPIETTTNYSVNYGEISSLKSYKGSRSALLSKQHPFGLTIDINDVQPGEIVNVSLYKSSSSRATKLVLDGNDGWNFYKQFVAVDSTENGWIKLSAWARAPLSLKKPALRVYAYHTGKDSIWVDNMVINRTLSNVPIELPVNTFAEVCYDLMKDYFIRQYQALPEDSLEAYAKSNNGSLILASHAVEINDFLTTLNALHSKPIDLVKSYKKKNHFASVSFTHEPPMDKKTVAGYLENMFLHKHDTAIIKLETNERPIKISLNKITGPYQTQPILNWTTTKSTVELSCLNIPSGSYIIVLTQETESFKLPLFINDTIADVIVVAPYTTWQAYNMYGGKSLYRNGIDNNDVNFVQTNRPITSIYYEPVESKHDLFVFNNIVDWFKKEYKVAVFPDYWLESKPELFKNAKSIILGQHCEYFSPNMYENLKILANSRNLISLGGNQLYWSILWHDNFTTIECRKDGDFFQNLNIPGGLWRNQFTSEAALLGVAYTPEGIATYAPYRVDQPNHWLFKNSQVNDSSLFGTVGIDGKPICGDETDKIIVGTPIETEIIARGINPKNGGGVMSYIPRDKHGTLSCGSIVCGAGLGVDSVFTQIIKNFMLRHHSY